MPTTTTSFEPRDLMHQLTPSKHALSFPWPQKQTEPETGNSKTEEIYVHPLVKRSSSSLSSKSLEMCTESLCSETGNDIISNLDEFYQQHALEKQSSCRKNQELPKKTKKISNFPPPLSSISGNEGVQVKTHREDGRLVIKAFNFSCCNHFQTERENGRLKLSLLRDSFRDSENDELEGNEKEEEEEENVTEVVKNCSDDESDEEDDFDGRYWGENNARGDGGEIGCKINGGDWSGGGRCNGDSSSRSKRLPSLPFCVAIS